MHCEHVTPPFWSNEVDKMDGANAPKADYISSIRRSQLYGFSGLNHACLAESMRRTTLFHFGDPREKSIFRRCSQLLFDARNRLIAVKAAQASRTRDRRHSWRIGFTSRGRKAISE